MADQTKTILTKIKQAIDAQRATGQPMSYLVGCYIVQHPVHVNLDVSAAMPFVLIYPMVQSVTPDAMTPKTVRSNRKVLTVTVSVFGDVYDESVGLMGSTSKKGVIEMGEALETLLDRNTLSNTVLQTVLKAISYQPVNLPGFVGVNQTHLTLDYTYVDRR